MTGLELSLVPFAQAGLAQRCNPQMVAFASLLAMPAADVTTMVERELEANPALERAEVARCVVCGGRGCGRCAWRRYAAPENTPAEALPTRPSPRDELFCDAAQLAHPSDRPLLRLLVDSLDDRGWLRPPDRRALPASEHQIERVIALLREVGPPGIAAPDAVSGMLVQLETHDDPPVSVVREMLGAHLEQVARGELDAVAAALGLAPSALAEALDWMRSTLRPFAIRLDVPAEPPPSAPPDVAVFEHPARDGRLVVDVLERRDLALRVDDGFRRLAVTCAEAAEHVAAATRLIHRLEQRWTTLRRVTTEAVRAQRSWITGRGTLVDLTRAEVARYLRCHESTVSRCVADRRLMLPDGRTIPLAELFQSGGAAKAALRDLVAHEAVPLADGALAYELRQRGYDVARRTVAKYRSELGIGTAPTRARVTTP